jgi:hypothetical protein
MNILYICHILHIYYNYIYIYIHNSSLSLPPPRAQHPSLPHTMLQKPRAVSCRFLALAVVARASGSAAPQGNSPNMSTIEFDDLPISAVI